MGAKTVPGAAVCTGGNGRSPKHTGKHESGTGSAGSDQTLQLSVPDRIYVQRAETANGSILLPFLVKIYAKTELLQEERGTNTPGTSGNREGPQINPGSGTCHGNAHSPILHSNGIAPESFHPLYAESQIQPAPLPENAVKGTCVGRHPHALFPETFFPSYGTNARITYNANNSGTAGKVRNLLGFTGFLVMQTFYSQVTLKYSFMSVLMIWL